LLEVNLLHVGSPMFRLLLASTTALAVCWHTVGGCGEHHTHSKVASPCGCSEHNNAHGQPHSHRGHNHGHAAKQVNRAVAVDSTESESPPPCPCDCREGSCAFAISKHFEPREPRDQPLAGIVPIAFRSMAAQGPTATNGRFSCAATGCSAPALRLHLALGVLLI
jgi:hypothetical protein